MEEEKIHIGQIVETIFYQSNKSKSEFAKDLEVTANPKMFIQIEVDNSKVSQIMNILDKKEIYSIVKTL